MKQQVPASQPYQKRLLKPQVRVSQHFDYRFYSNHATPKYLSLPRQKRPANAPPSTKNRGKPNNRSAPDTPADKAFYSTLAYSTYVFPSCTVVLLCP